MQDLINSVELEYLIANVTLLWRRLLNNSAKHLNITGTERRVLLTVSCHAGATQKCIADLLELEPQNLMRALDKLEKADLIERNTSDTDRRVKCVCLTSQGKEMVKQIKAIAKQIRLIIFDEVKEKDLNSFIQVLETLNTNLATQLQCDNKGCR